MKPCWVGMAGWCHVTPGVGKRKSPRGSQEACLSASHLPWPLPWGQGISVAASIAVLQVPRAPFDVTCRSPPRKWKMQPIFQMCFSTRCLFCGCVWLSRWGTDVWVGPGWPTLRVRWEAGRWSTLFSKSGHQPGEPCPLKGSLILAHTPPAYVSKGWEKKILDYQSRSNESVCIG